MDLTYQLLFLFKSLSTIGTYFIMLIWTIIYKYKKAFYTLSNMVDEIVN
jgi:hypothetical protein